MLSGKFGPGGLVHSIYTLVIKALIIHETSPISYRKQLRIYKYKSLNDFKTALLLELLDLPALLFVSLANLFIVVHLRETLCLYMLVIGLFAHGHQVVDRCTLLRVPAGQVKLSGICVCYDALPFINVPHEDIHVLEIELQIVWLHSCFPFITHEAVVQFYIMRIPYVICFEGLVRLVAELAKNIRRDSLSNKGRHRSKNGDYSNSVVFKYSVLVRVFFLSFVEGKKLFRSLLPRVYACYPFPDSQFVQLLPQS